MPPESSGPLAPSNPTKAAQAVQLLEQALSLLDQIPDTEHLAAHVQGVIDELHGQDVDSQ
jgi:hypothetical protein